MDNDEIGIIERLKQENNLSRDKSINLKQMRNEVLINYSVNNQKEIFYIFRKEENENYVLYKSSINGELSKEIIPKENLPQNSGIDAVLINENGCFFVDEEATKNIQEKILFEAKKIIANTFVPIEGESYYVVEGKNEVVYLMKIGENIVYAENNMPEEIKKQLSSGIILKYENGNYIIETGL